jgi:hypothetical protein
MIRIHLHYIRDMETNPRFSKNPDPVFLTTVSVNTDNDPAKLYFFQDNSILILSFKNETYSVNKH